MKYFKVIMQDGVGGCVFSYQIEYTDGIQILANQYNPSNPIQILAMKL